MTFRLMMVAGLLAVASEPALANEGARHVDIGELQRIGEEGRGVWSSAATSPEMEAAAGLGLGELQQRSEEGRGEHRDAPATEASTPTYDLGEAQRRAEEGRGESGPGSRTGYDVATRD